MIEKLENTIKDGDFYPTVPKNSELMEKINEIIDVVNNRILKEYSSIEDVIKDSELDIKSEPADQYAEQRKWIGKLCKFSQLCGCYQHIAILKRISESGLYVTDDGELHYAYCEQVKPDDDIIYKGEQ